MPKPPTSQSPSKKDLQELIDRLLVINGRLVNEVTFLKRTIATLHRKKAPSNFNGVVKVTKRSVGLSQSKRQRPLRSARN